MPLVCSLIRLGNECVCVRLPELRVIRWQGIDEVWGWDLSLFPSSLLKQPVASLAGKPPSDKEISLLQLGGFCLDDSEFQPGSVLWQGLGQASRGLRMYTGHYMCQQCLCSEESHFYACHHTHPQNSLMRLECEMLLPSTHLPRAFLASLLAGTFQIELMLTGPPGFEASWALDMSPHCAPSTQHLYHRQPPDSARWHVSHPCPPRDLAGSLLSPYCSVTHRRQLLDALALPGVLLRLVIDR